MSILIIMLPLIDISNPPIEVYYNATELGTEVTVVFSDEDHPNPIVDFFYDVYRFFKWGRIADVETFFLGEDSVYFPDDYASVTSFHQTEDSTRKG